MIERMEAPRESPLPSKQREELRARIRSETPRWYSPWFHFGFPSVFGLVIESGTGRNCRRQFK